jgi:hypothetical protein
METEIWVALIAAAAAILAAVIPEIEIGGHHTQFKVETSKMPP